MYVCLYIYIYIYIYIYVSSLYAKLTHYTVSIKRRFYTKLTWYGIQYPPRRDSTYPRHHGNAQKKETEAPNCTENQGSSSTLKKPWENLHYSCEDGLSIGKLIKEKDEKS